MTPTFANWVGLAWPKRNPEWESVANARLRRDPCPGQDVNAWVNRTIRYTREAVDHWQEPAETLALKTGDCEDYAILKRAVLIARGVAPEATFIIIGHDLALREAHAVLLAEGKVYDNLMDVVVSPVELAGSFTPVIAYGAGTWLFGRRR